MPAGHRTLTGPEVGTRWGGDGMTEAASSLLTRRVREALSVSERDERAALIAFLQPLAVRQLPPRLGVKRQIVSASEVLNEATAYSRPVSFSRGLRVEVETAVSHVFISGTASVGPAGETLHVGDFRAQCWRTYRNLTSLLESAGASWQDVVACRCYLRDIDRDYDAFNEIRTELFEELRLRPLPASTAVQARLSRPDLLVEIEVHAIVAGRTRAESE